MASTLNWELITSYALSLVDVIKLGKIETDGKQLFVEGIASDNVITENSKNILDPELHPTYLLKSLFINLGN